MTSTQFYPTAAELTTRLRREIAMINALISRSDIVLNQHDADNLELAEINLCFAETLAYTEGSEGVRHYAQKGLRAIDAIPPGHIVPF